ncbi:hypothetical protein PACTADRAFT_47673 [Pachysolen tannophilus NRRL Y-2460]|uniref:DUF155 domain-containing protein n=1 Tax=Pachysolen tannophilus NRRL Y-2460 TaxID=669874 RepID=A0A1E4U1F4_PACTA|nr:hypothetical protein PACTADRAFT_47673 [Pachysolen tannophilus NRRL Y-2460]
MSSSNSESKKQLQNDIIARQKKQNKRPTAKRSPSILVTDVRHNLNTAQRSSAPFAGHKYNSAQKKTDGANKLNKISVSNIISDISDIPSARKRQEPPNYGSIVNSMQTGTRRLTKRNIPTLSQPLPSRTSKTSQKLVLIPYDEDENQYYEEPPHPQFAPQPQVAIDPKRLRSYQRSRAENMTKEQRADEYSRVTAYLIAQGMNLKLTSHFLKKNHLVLPRLYDEVLYVPYSLPLLPGPNGYRVQSNNSAKVLNSKKLMENFIDNSELKDHHFEYFSGVDASGNDNLVLNENSDISKFNQNTNRPIDLGKSDLMNSGNNNNNNGNDFDNNNNGGFDPSEPQFFPSPNNSPSNEFHPPPSSSSSHDSQIVQDNNKDNGDGENSEIHDVGNLSIESSENGESDSSGSGNGNGNGNNDNNSQKLPDLTKHAELFIFNYGVVVFWNFSEIHEKNILADLAFAKLDPHEITDEDDDYDDDEEEDNENDNENDGADGSEEEMLSLLRKPIHEQDIETEEFHFEYRKEISTPRIYNDMITLKSGDHLIKLTISHSIAQSTKLCYYESRMSHILSSISKLPKMLALTGKLETIKTRKKLLTKTARLIQLRNEINLISNVLDTPEFFWSFEPSLHPLYNAIRDYLEIDQRVEVLNDRCQIFLDFFDVISDSIAETNMNRITKMIIYVLLVMIVVSCVEILIRYLIIKRDHLKF